MATALLIGLTFTSSIIGWMLCTLIIYSAYIFYKFRRDQALQKRYPPLVYLITISVVFYLGFSESLMQVLLLYKGQYKGSGEEIIRFFDYLFYSFSLHGATIAMISRAWIVYFNIKWGLETKKAKWTVHISPKQVSTFWYIQHRKDYGSFKYIKTFACTYYVSVGMFLLIVWYARRHYYWLPVLIDSLLYLIEIIILIIIWYKIPTFADIFGTKSELKYALRSGMFCSITYILWIILGFIVLPPDIAQVMYPMFMLCIDIGLTLIVLIFNSYIFWGKYKYLLSTKDNDVMTMIDIHKNDRSDSNIQRLSNTLQNEQSFEAFFEHLSDEFSVELLLSYIEFIQFKHLIKTDGIMDIQNIDNQTDITHNLPVPQSHIVFESHKNISNHIGKYVLISIDLFNKYISNVSEYEINISFAHRNNVTSFINKYRDMNNIDLLQLTETEQHQLYSLYDNCIETVYQLMTYSHQRFRETSRYTSMSV